MNYSKKSILKGFLIVLYLFVGNTISAQKLNKQKDIDFSDLRMLENDDQVKVGKLENGFTYYIRKNIEPKNRAVLYLAVKAGSVLETDEQQGLAHFTEHMAFKGTRDFPKNQIIEELQSSGVQFGNDLNAYTSFDHTVYELPIPTDDAGLLSKGVKILFNWAGLVTMEGSAIDTERGIIVEEERQRMKNVDGRMLNQSIPILYRNSRFADRMPIGNMDVVKSFDHKVIRDFYKDWYRPNLQTIIAVGDFDPQIVEKLIIETFSKLSNPDNEKKLEQYTLPVKISPVIRTITDDEFPYFVVEGNIKHVIISNKTVADRKKTIIFQMINSMMERRLDELLEMGKAHFVNGGFSYNSYPYDIVPEQKSSNFYAVSRKAEGLDTAFREVMTEAKRMLRYGFIDSEFDQTKLNIYAYIENRKQEASKITSSQYVAKYLEHFLRGNPYLSSTYEYNVDKYLVDIITLDEVNSVAKTMLEGDEMTVIIKAPTKDAHKLPSEEQIINIIKESPDNIQAYQRETFDKKIMSIKPLAGNIIKENKNTDLGLTTLFLSNGIKVILKPTDFKNDEIIFSSFSPGGYSLVSDSKANNVRYAHKIPSNGFGNFNRSQIIEVLAGKDVSVHPYISELYQGVRGKTAVIDLETAMQHMYTQLTTPRADSLLFKKWIADYKLSREASLISPEGIFADTLNGIKTSYSPRTRPLTNRDIDHISLQESFAFFKDRFSNLGNQVYIMVGNFEIDSIKPLIKQYIAALPASKKKDKFIDRKIHPLPGKIFRTVHKGLDENSKATLSYHGIFDPKDRITMYALENILEKKIFERLRNQENAVYSPAVNMNIEVLPSPYFDLNISLNSSPQQVEHLLNLVQQEIENIKKDSIHEDELQKFVAESLRSHELNLRNNNFWLSYLGDCERGERHLDDVIKVKEHLNAVTPDSIKKVASKYLTGKNVIKVVLLPNK